MTAQLVLDRAQSLAAVQVLADDPGRYADALAAELPAAGTLAELDARDTALRRALDALDTLAARVMRLHLQHADDPALPPPTRNVFATTVLAYATDLDRLAERVRDIAARARAADPDASATRVVDAARATYALRDALAAPVFALVRDLAAAAIAGADARARDRRLEEPTRRRWSAARRDLEQQAADPLTVLAAPMAQRLAALPEQLDEPDPASEPTFADMIELD